MSTRFQPLHPKRGGLIATVLLSTFYLIPMLPAQDEPRYDESTVPEYTLPPLLTDAAGQEIATETAWRARRSELLDRFRDEVYGTFPAAGIRAWPEAVRREAGALCGLADRKLVRLVLSNGTDTLYADLLLYLPAARTGRVPVFLGLNFSGNHTVHVDPAIPVTANWVRNSPPECVFDHRATAVSRGVRASRWPVERILARGYGLATLYCGDFDPDFDDGFQNGVHRLLRRDSAAPADTSTWSTLAAWAFGLSKAMDYLVTDPDVTADRVAVIGHSRLGKAALWAGARDERFALVISNNSGCGGAALSRRRFGETVRAINTQFPHWFADRFQRYNDREDDLPVDQHQLLALVAPRPLYVASAEQDRWADPRGEYLALYHASRVYALYGYAGLDQADPPAVNAPRVPGRVGYHIRSGAHDITRYDWERYLDFADAQWGE
jgi:hypothetical protein